MPPSSHRHLAHLWAADLLRRLQGRSHRGGQELIWGRTQGKTSSHSIYAHAPP